MKNSEMFVVLFCTVISSLFIVVNLQQNFINEIWNFFCTIFILIINLTMLINYLKNNKNEKN